MNLFKRKPHTTNINTIKSEKLELLKINLFGEKVYCPNCARTEVSSKMKAVSILLGSQTMTGLDSICYHCNRCGGYLHSPIEDFMGIHIGGDEDNLLDDKDDDQELDLDYGAKFRDNIY